MNKIVKVKGYACGYYNNAEYSESFYITEDFYNKYKDELPEEFCAGELDGKHSEIYGDIEYTILDIGLDTKDIDREIDNADDRVYDKLFDLDEEDFEKSCKEVRAFMNNADLYADITFKVRESQIDEVKSLIEEYLQSKNLEK